MRQEAVGSLRVVRIKWTPFEICSTPVWLNGNGSVIAAVLGTQVKDSSSPVLVVLGHLGIRYKSGGVTNPLIGAELMKVNVLCVTSFRWRRHRRSQSW